MRWYAEWLFVLMVSFWNGLLFAALLEIEVSHRGADWWKYLIGVSVFAFCFFYSWYRMSKIRAQIEKEQEIKRLEEKWKP